MSKTVEELANEFRKHWLKHERMDDDIRAGIVAVVRAIRDECDPDKFPRAGYMCWGDFNEILGSDAGNERVAGGPRSETMGSAPSATDPCPDCGGRKYLAKPSLNGTYYEHCYCPKLKATDPAPAEREKTRNAAADAIEAMAGEVERLKAQQKADDEHAQKATEVLSAFITRTEEAEAERDRLKAALLIAQDAMQERRAYCHEWEYKYKQIWDVEDEEVRKALGGDAS